MGKFLSAPLIAAAFLMTFTAAPAWAGDAGNTVKITPLGSDAGEFCRRDRALVFEDPNHTRILYDAGRTVLTSTDPRLGLIQVVLLSSVHSDHLGERLRLGGNCANPPGGASTTPDSNTAEIAANVANGAGTGAQVYVGGEMSKFLEAKIVDAGGTNSQDHTLRPGGSVVVGTDGKTVPEGDPGVEIAVIPAIHSNGIDKAFITDAILKTGLGADNLTAYGGPDHGYILKFTNGLVVYMTGDTGITSDMKLVVKDFYRPKLVVINLGDGPSFGPKEAAFAINNLIKPRSVIPSHANEETTVGGVVQAGTQTERFIDLLDGKIFAHVPLSGLTMEFNRQGKCVAGTC